MNKLHNWRRHRTTHRGHRRHLWRSRRRKQRLQLWHCGSGRPSRHTLHPYHRLRSQLATGHHLFAEVIIVRTVLLPAHSHEQRNDRRRRRRNRGPPVQRRWHRSTSGYGWHRGTRHLRTGSHHRLGLNGGCLFGQLLRCNFLRIVHGK